MSIKEKIYYFLVLAFFRLITLLPLRLLFLLAEGITFLVYRIIGYRKKVVFKNLEKSFPEKSKKEIKHIARKYYRHMSVMMVENIHLRFATNKHFQKHLILKNPEVLYDFYNSGKNVIIMLGHFGNWEMAAGLSRQLPFEVAAVYKKLSSKVFDKIYFDIRQRAGVRPIEMKESLRKTLEMVKSGNQFMLFMIADQAPNRSEAMHWISFLNQDTSVFIGSEKLAKKFDMPVVYAELLRVKKGRYKMTFTTITEKPKETEPMEITKRFFALLEESIIRGPRYWLWSHRRWKKTRK